MSRIDEVMDITDFAKSRVDMQIPDASSQEPAFFSAQVIKARRFYLNSKPLFRPGLFVVCGGFEQCTPDYVINRKTFPNLCLEFVLHGRGQLRLKSRDADLESGVIFTYGPGVPHRMTSDTDDPLEKYFVDFKGRAAKRLLYSCNLAPGAYRRIAAPSEITRILTDLIADGSQGGPFASDLCAALLEYLLFRIAGSADPGEEKHSAAYSTYLRCRNRIESEFLRLHTLRDVAAAARVDQAYLCRLFQRYDHQTPYQLLTRLKMNKAAELLHDEGRLIKQVAASIGYADPFHFSRSFKNTFGVSPEAFRGHRR